MNAVAAALNSRRVIRLLPWLAGLVLIAGVVAFMIAYFGNTSNVGKLAPSEISSAQVQQEKTPKTVPLDPEVKRVAQRFIYTAVARKDPVTAYRISGPDIRQGASLAQWKRDWNDPNVGVAVIPYPVDQVEASPFRVHYSYKNEALLEVALLPKAGAKIKPQLFWVLLKKFGSGSNQRWLVNFWAPHNVVAVPSVQ